MAPKIAVIYYSMYGHVAELAQAELEGIRSTNGEADVYQLPETMPQHILDGFHAPPQNQAIPLIKPDLLRQYDGFLFGVPTRYGNYPAQWKTFIDQTGPLWLSNALCGKYFGLFISTATMGGGQESTALAALSTWIHHGMIFVPLAGPSVSKITGDLSEVRGGSPWGAGTFSSGDGSRHPTAKELELARIQGQSFYKTVHKAHS